MPKKFTIGLLSTIDNPLLPFFIKEIFKRNFSKILVICDLKKTSEKDMKIWSQRTGGYFEKKFDDDTETFVSLKYLKTPFYFVKNHNSNPTKLLIKNLSVDVLLNAGTPRKLSKLILNTTPYGVINIHPGILPQYRGCSAVEWSIYNNDRIGNTAHFMTENYDDGPIIIKEKYNFSKENNYSSIRVKTFEKGCVLAAKALNIVKERKMNLKNAILQDETQAKFWKPIPDHKFKRVINIIKNKTYLLKKK